ncbi:MAG: cytochrome c [Caldilineaceae bacterium]
MPYNINYFQRLPFILAILFILLFSVACGRSQGTGSTTSRGDSASGQSSSSARPAAPTMPSGNFTAVGQQSILTGTTSLTETMATTETVSATAADLARGESAYTKNNCGDCHGSAGEGVADKGGAIAGATLSLEEFDAVLRTGGGLGNTHIFGRSAVSPSGMEALYAYVQSLGQ